MAADEGRGAPGGAGAVGRRARGRWTDGQEPSRQARVAHDPRPPPLPAAAVRVAGARAPHRRHRRRGRRDRGGDRLGLGAAARTAEDAEGTGHGWQRDGLCHVVQPALARAAAPAGNARAPARPPGALRIRRPLLRPERRRRDGGLRSRLSSQRGRDAEEVARAGRRGARPRAGPARPAAGGAQAAREPASARRRALGAPPSPLRRGGRARPPPAGLRRAARTPAGPVAPSPRRGGRGRAGARRAR